MVATWVTRRSAETEWCWLPVNCFAQEMVTGGGNCWGTECHSQRQESKGSDVRERTRKSLRAQRVKQRLKTDFNIVHQDMVTQACDPSTLESRQEDQGELKSSLGYIARFPLPISKQIGGIKAMLSASAFGLVLQRAVLFF